MLNASAENVVAITLMPAMPGTITSSCSWSLEKTAPNSARNSSGSRKLKNAALGLRQNMRRSRRYWRQVSTARSAIGRSRGQLEVDLFEARAAHRQVLQALPARERRRRQLRQPRGRVVGDLLVRLPVGVAGGDPVARRVLAAEVARRAFGEDPPVLDDRDAVGERLRLVEVV